MRISEYKLCLKSFVRPILFDEYVLELYVSMVKVRLLKLIKKVVKSSKHHSKICFVKFNVLDEHSFEALQANWIKLAHDNN